MPDAGSAVDEAKEVASTEVSVGEAAVYAGVILAGLKLLADSAEVLPIGFETKLDDLIETLFTPLSWAADVLFE
jgi:hypothetical protein